jgi:hypothetical protein
MRSDAMSTTSHLLRNSPPHLVLLIGHRSSPLFETFQVSLYLKLCIAFPAGESISSLATLLTMHLTRFVVLPGRVSLGNAEY